MQTGEMGRVKQGPTNTRFIVCFAGIFISYFYYGIVQEKITRSRYGPEDERFTYTQALVFGQCIVNALFAASIIWLSTPQLDDTPTEYYAACSFSYLAAMISSNHALQFVPYPTQVLGKSCKPIPIMLLGVLIAKKRYPVLKYLFVGMIVAGVALFLYKDEKPGAPASVFSIGAGEMLLLFSLAMDGTTGAIQDKIRENHTSRNVQMMFNMNLWSSLYLFIGLFVTGEIGLFWNFVTRFPHVLANMGMFAVTSAIGQYFIFSMVTEFGPLSCSIVTTTRKFFTILVSVIYFQNAMSSKKWIGTFLVFLGLFLDILFGKKRAPPKEIRAK